MYILFRRDENGLACLNWWRDRCNEWCNKRLEDGKEAAGDKLFGGKGVTVEWGGREFNLLAKGTKGYEYVMFNDDARLYLARDCQGGRGRS